MKKTGILFYSHQANLAGAPLSISALAEALSKKYRVVFVCPVDGPILSKIKCKKYVIGHWFQERKLDQIIKNEQIDLVHANTILAMPAVKAANRLKV